MHGDAWVVLSSEYVLDSKYLRIRRERVRLPTGEVRPEYYVNERPGWVAVFCQTVGGLVVLNRQYKHGIRREVIELPAGTIEMGESPQDCARRELLEETGYAVAELEFVGKFIIDPTYCDGHMYLYYGKNAVRTADRGNAPSEQNQTMLVPPCEVLDMVRRGHIDVLGHVAAIYRIFELKSDSLGGTNRCLRKARK